MLYVTTRRHCIMDTKKDIDIMLQAMRHMLYVRGYVSHMLEVIIHVLKSRGHITNQWSCAISNISYYRSHVIRHVFHATHIIRSTPKFCVLHNTGHMLQARDYVYPNLWSYVKALVESHVK